MQKHTTANKEQGLHRALGFRDLVLLNLSCIIGMGALAQAAQFGYASLLLYLLAALTFLIPSGLMVAELNARMPEEGGFYLWIRTAFGEIHGYIAAWSYWISNVVWLPTVLLLISVSVLHMHGNAWLHLSENTTYNLVVCLGLLWFVTILNIIGLEKAKWIQNIGGIATWVAISLLLVVGVMYAYDHGSAQELRIDQFWPDFSDTSVLPYFAIIAMSFGGLEMAPVMAGEIERPERNIPRAIWGAALIALLVYMTGTLVLLVTLPKGTIGIIDGVLQAYGAVGTGMQAPWIGTVGSLLVVLSSIGLFGAWMTGTARIPFVVGLEHYLPEVVGSVHPRWGSPYVALIMQAIVLTILFALSVAGASVKEVFLILLDMSIILYFIPFLYMFAALVKHHNLNTGGDGMIRMFRKSRVAIYVVAALGFGITLFSTVISAVPTKDIENKGLFLLKVIGGAALLLGFGLSVYLLKKKDHMQADKSGAQPGNVFKNG